jgi:hypothetical protein
MKLAIISVLALGAVVLGAQMPQAKDAIKAAGGMITHEYKLIK